MIKSASHADSGSEPTSSLMKSSGSNVESTVSRSISVSPARKVGEGVSAYYVYKISSTTRSNESVQVERRYNDFYWLYEQLCKAYPGWIIPPLPVKVLAMLQGPEFLERRRAGLERFLNKVATHEELRQLDCFQEFLHRSTEQFSELKKERDVMNTTMNQLSDLWSVTIQRLTDSGVLTKAPSSTSTDTSTGTKPSLHSSRSSIMAANANEDPEFAKALRYITKLDALVRNLKERAHMTHKQTRAAANAYCSLSESLYAISRFEQSYDSETPRLASDVDATCSAIETRARQMDNELAHFVASIDYYSRWVSAVLKAVDVREDRRRKYQSKLAAAERNSLRNYHKSLAEGGEEKPATPTANNSTMHADDESCQELEQASEDFEQVHERVMQEVARFRSDKSHELRDLLIEFTKLQQRNTSELDSVLSSCTTQLTSDAPEHELSPLSQKAGEATKNSPDVRTAESEESLEGGEKEVDVSKEPKDELRSEASSQLEDVTI